MRTAHTVDSSTKLLLIPATLVALATGLVYFTIALGLVAANFQSPPRPVMLLAGVVYVMGTGLIHVVDRRLLLLGAAAKRGGTRPRRTVSGPRKCESMHSVLAGRRRRSA